jgi:hypothetical protein
MPPKNELTPDEQRAWKSLVSKGAAGYLPTKRDGVALPVVARYRVEHAAKPAKAPIPTESQEQSALVAWFRREHLNLGVPSEKLLIASPAGTMLGGSDDRMRFARHAKLKREGMVKGVPDLLLAVPRSPWNGFWIEMKRAKGGTVSPEQKEMHALLYAQGYAVAVAKGCDDARALIETYLSAQTVSP